MLRNKRGVFIKGWKRGKVVKCKRCANEFYVLPSQIGKVRFCSRSCARRSHIFKPLPMSEVVRLYKKGWPLEKLGKKYGVNGSTICKKLRKVGTKRRVAGFQKGSKKSKATIAKISGPNNHRWKGGKSSPNELIRKSFEYKLWRRAVFERDNYACIWCGQRGSILHADHIKPFALFPELRFAIDNGRTLCVQCHKKTSTYGGNTR